MSTEEEHIAYNFDVRKALEWVSGIPYEQHHNTNKSEILQGTGLWLFEEEIYAKWKQGGRSTILWLHGIRGFTCPLLSLETI